jgi:hypothetical protein
MLTIIAKRRVFPTDLYHCTVKSSYCPFSNGKYFGMSKKGFFVFTSRIIREVLMNSKRNIVAMLEAFSSVLLR